MELGKTIMFIDNSNIFQNLRCIKPGYRIDYKKLHEKIEERSSIWETYFFAAEREGSPRDTQTAFFDVLRKELGYNIVLATLKVKTISCRKCGEPHEVYLEKGVDMSLASRFLTLLYSRAFDTAILVTGDGDYADIAREARRLGRKIIVVSFRDSLSKELSAVSSLAPVYLDDISGDIELEREPSYDSAPQQQNSYYQPYPGGTDECEY